MWQPETIESEYHFATSDDFSWNTSESEEYNWLTYGLIVGYLANRSLECPQATSHLLQNDVQQVNLLYTALDGYISALGTGSL